MYLYTNSTISREYGLIQPLSKPSQHRLHGHGSDSELVPSCVTRPLIGPGQAGPIRTNPNAPQGAPYTDDFVRGT